MSGISEEYEKIGEEIFIETLDVKLPMEDIYERSKL